jgi:hypothetical protein
MLNDFEFVSTLRLRMEDKWLVILYYPIAYCLLPIDSRLTSHDSRQE